MADKKQGIIYLRNSSNTEISFPVKREGITTERNFKINEQEMYSNNSTQHRTNYYHNGSGGLSFSVTAIFKNNDKKVMRVLDDWYRKLSPLTIVFGKHLNMQLPLVSKKWVITKIVMKQEYDTVTEWDLTFKTYNPPQKIKKVENEFLNRTSKSYKFQTKCKKTYWKLRYKKMKGKKATDCTKLLNQILVDCGCMPKLKKKVKTNKKDNKGRPIYKKVKYIPDKYVYKTSKGVKRFKKQWNKYKLKPKLKKTNSDKIDKDTYKALCNYKKLKTAKKKK